MATQNGYSVTVDDEELKRFLNQLPGTLAENVRVIFQDATREAQKTVRGNFNSTGNIGSDKLTSRTGLLAKSIATAISNAGTSLANIDGSVFSDVLYAPIQETGGTVQAKNAYAGLTGGPYLNIPLGANLTPAGVMRYSARDVFNMGGFIFMSRRGNYLIGLATELGIQLMFCLKKSVYIKPRLGMQNAVEVQIPYMIEALNNLALE